MSYAIAKWPTPVYDTSDLSSIYARADGRLPLDDQGLMRRLETVAFPGTVFTVHEAVQDKILRVTTSEYEYAGSFYIDARFVDRQNEEPRERTKRSFTGEEILERLERMIGGKYIWGGNWPEGIPQIEEFYKPRMALDPVHAKQWRLEGVDCSGLLYYATDGLTPRNTSKLCEYGHEVAIERLTAEEIVDQLKPLDCIVWRGHVVVVYKDSRTIESLGKEGVVTKELNDRLGMIMKDRKPANKWAQGTFVVRRWMNV